MKKRVMIPEQEYFDRIAKAAKLVGEAGLDVLISNCTEADYSFVRYFTNFWPLFETAGVAIAPNGKAALMVGPESEKYAADRSVLKDIFALLEYRESADPAYPEYKPSTFKDVFKHIGVKGEKLRIGIAGYLVSNPIQLEGLRANFPNAEIVRADDIVRQLRVIKSENEIACMREGFRIVELATKDVLNAIQPGMTELQMVGVAQKAIYEHGAEYEGLPMYVFSEKSTSHAISRSTYREISKGDIVQLNLSAKIEGYSPSIGMPISMGPLTGEKRELVEFGLDMHKWTYKQLRAGVEASQVAKDYIQRFKDAGREKNFVYGPCHGTGMIEVEAPWMETSSTYKLEPNMTFQVDTFASGSTYGLRWETGVRITEGGHEVLSSPIGEIHEISC
ncbi:MAG: M24 family metallopeptidase [Sphaerochaetaceae bacterium]|nr:Xaa-Pro peptidase family protein [Sphaerochaetaceae bacterium]